MLQFVGMAVAILAIILISREDNTRIRLADLRLPLLAGFGFGFYLMFIARATTVSPLWPIIFGRFASITMVGLVAWRIGALKRPDWPELRLIAASGLFDTAGNTLCSPRRWPRRHRGDSIVALIPLRPSAWG